MKLDSFDVLNGLTEPMTAASVSSKHRVSFAGAYVVLMRLLEVGHVYRFKENTRFYYGITQSGLDFVKREGVKIEKLSSDIKNSVSKVEVSLEPPLPPEEDFRIDDESFCSHDILRVLTKEELEKSGVEFFGDLIVNREKGQALTTKDFGLLGKTFNVKRVDGEKIFYNGSASSFVWPWAVTKEISKDDPRFPKEILLKIFSGIKTKNSLIASLGISKASLCYKMRVLIFGGYVSTKRTKNTESVYSVTESGLKLAKEFSGISESFGGHKRGEFVAYVANGLSTKELGLVPGQELKLFVCGNGGYSIFKKTV